MCLIASNNNINLILAPRQVRKGKYESTKYTRWALTPVHVFELQRFFDIGEFDHMLVRAFRDRVPVSYGEIDEPCVLDRNSFRPIRTPPWTLSHIYAVCVL
jgi:hypothetical protein